MSDTPKRGWFQLHLSTALLLMLLASVSVGLLVYWIYYPTGPVGVLQTNRDAITNYAKSILTETIQEGETPGYPMPRILRQNGARSVRRSGGCVVIQFEFMPTDAIPELIYSPKGYDGLPQNYKTPGKEITFFRLQKIDEKWFFCEWDN